MVTVQRFSGSCRRMLRLGLVPCHFISPRRLSLLVLSAMGFSGAISPTRARSPLLTATRAQIFRSPGGPTARHVVPPTPNAYVRYVASHKHTRDPFKMPISTASVDAGEYAWMTLGD